MYKCKIYIFPRTLNNDDYNTTFSTMLRLRNARLSSTEVTDVLYMKYRRRWHDPEQVILVLRCKTEHSCWSIITFRFYHGTRWKEIFFYLKSPVRKIGLKILLSALCYLFILSMRVLLSHNVSFLEKVHGVPWKQCVSLQSTYILYFIWLTVSVF